MENQPEHLKTRDEIDQMQLLEQQQRQRENGLEPPVQHKEKANDKPS